MLTSHSPAVFHVLQNIALIALSFAFLPLDLSVLLSSYALIFVEKLFGERQNQDKSVYGKQVDDPYTVLITGMGMTKALVLARAFHTAPGVDRVIGADFSSISPGRASRALSCFYRLEKPNQGSTSGSAPYIQSLLDIILKEKVDLWVSCSGVASAVEDGEAKELIESRTSCRAIQFDVATTRTLHEKHTFIARTAEIGLMVPETHTVLSRAGAESALQRAPVGRKFIIKTIGMNDQMRGDMTLLPKETEEATREHLDRLVIDEKNQWILQQFVQGDEYCTHALVVRGKVLVFVACPSSELLMHYQALPATSAISRAMLRFTTLYAAKGGPAFTGHLSFDFLVDVLPPENAEDLALYPIECNPRAHTAVTLFNSTLNMVSAYLSVLEHENNSKTPCDMVIPSNSRRKYYWIGHDIVALVLHPLLCFCSSHISFIQLARSIASFLVHLFFWKDGTFEVWDPLPWFVLYHVYWPMEFLSCLRSGKRWSRVNVSTLKMFEC